MPTNIYNVRPDCQIPGLEWIYNAVFGQKTDGVFVEVGAFDGVSYSNTVFLAELGWRGIYVEPINHLWNKCCANHRDHPNITVFMGAIGDGSDVRIWGHPGQDYLYTANKEFADLNSATNDNGVWHTITLDEFLPLYDIKKNFDLLVIDVEGYELEVLKGFTLNDWTPKLVIIETHELNANPDMAKRTPEIDRFFLTMSLGAYTKIYTSAINTIYMKV